MNWAAEHLQVIRTLMERSALYRRALAPVMTFAGLTGMAAAFVGVALRAETGPAFIAYWMAVALVGVAGTLMLVRRQALKSAEPFWSLPTRRVAQALLPSLTVGLLVGIWSFVAWSEKPVADPPTGTYDDAGQFIWLPALWAVFYGCALHAAGFFTSRGLKLLGWLYIAAGNAVLLWLFVTFRQDSYTPWESSHWLMGFLFGLLQLACGIYLYFTEKRGNES
ncbi:MAG: hypothetical protein MUF81_08345 [Verrucomicrobia bacterium]|nr:hypothetical protein [Verrucomicrobiota bacterium]